MRIENKKPIRLLFRLGIITLIMIGWISAIQLTPALAKLSESRFPGSFAELVKKSSPSVVNIIALKVIRSPGQGAAPLGPEDPMRDFFERFFGQQLPQEYRQNALGTGFVIDSEGFILTNNHVVEQTEELKVRFSDEEEFDAKIIGRDPKTDLALIKVDVPEPLTPLKLGDSDTLQVGDWVVAIGSDFCVRIQKFRQLQRKQRKRP